MTTRIEAIMDNTWPEAFRAPRPKKKVTVVPIKMLQEKLQELRGHFENTRPLLPTETRPFTYQKERKEMKMDKKGKPVLKRDKKGKPVLLKSGETVPIYQPVLDANGRDHLYDWVTEPSVVRLRKFGVPQAEAICSDLSRQMRELKDRIVEQGYEPIGYGESFAQWDVKRKAEEAANARADKKTEARELEKAEADAKEAKVKARLDRKLANKNKRWVPGIPKPIVKRLDVNALDDEFSKL